MRKLLASLLWISAAAATPGGAWADVADDDNTCILCHGNTDLWEGDTLHLLVTAESLAGDIHWQKGLRCQDCHGGDATSFDLRQVHALEDGFRKVESPADIPQFCGACHEDQAGRLAGDIHDQPPGEEGQDAQPLNCLKCHTEDVHGMLAVTNHDSPVFVNNQVATCGGCHQQAHSDYLASVHGLGLEKSGLLTTAVCSSCHHAHGVYPSSDERSSLYLTNVSETCGSCHRFIEERLDRSVHGRGDGLGGKSLETSVGGDSQRNPTCTDCHMGHDQPHPQSDRFRKALADRCGNCHADLEHGYAISMHGELTVLGYGAAAKCSDCHGAHDILPASDPASRLSAENRMQTCRQCHPNAVQNFLAYDPHTDHRDRVKYPLENTIYIVLLFFIFTTFGVFGIHSIFWLVRSLLDVTRNGRPKALVPGGTAYVRFRGFHRTAHTFMLVSFLGLALTGLPLKFSQYQWAQVLAQVMGGFDSTGLWHRIFGLVNVGCLAIYICLLAGKYFVGWRRGVPTRNVVFGPDSPVPNWRDMKDAWKMSLWFVGRGPKPTFERWAYWEKFDFWGACSDIVIIGLTGLILWLPNLFCQYLPGQTLAVAKVIHSTQALLATGFVFAIHFFNTHFRADKFPMDMSVLTGLVSEEEFEEERPEYYQRLAQEGTLEDKKTTVPSRGVLWLTGFGGFVALLIGLSLLVAMIAAGLSGIWLGN